MESTHTIVPEGAEKSLERQRRAFGWVRELCSGAGRRAGSAGEARAAGRLEAWLCELGFEELETRACQGSPDPGAALALHLALAALACAVGGLPGLLLAAGSWLSFRRGALGGRAPLARLLPAPRSLNLLARVGARAPRRRVVLAAPLCAGRTGTLFSERFREGLRHRLGVDDHPARSSVVVPVWLLAAAAGVCAAGALGADGAVFGVARVLLGAALVAAAALAFQWARAPVSPGANVAASGLAALLTAAEQLAAQLPPDVELWCLAAGGGESGASGLEAALEAHPEWCSDSTAFVHFHAVGGGTLGYARSEGILARSHHRPMLEELARRVAAGGAFAEPAALDLFGETGARAVSRHGLQLLSLVSVDESGAPRHWNQRDDLPEHLDMEGVVRAADFGCSVVSAHWRGDAAPLAYV